MSSQNFRVKNGLEVGSVEIANSSGVVNAAAITAGTGVTTNATGIHIGQAVATTSNVTFNTVTSTDLKDSSNRTLKIYDTDGSTVLWG